MQETGSLLEDVQNVFNKGRKLGRCEDRHAIDIPSGTLNKSLK